MLLLENHENDLHSNRLMTQNWQSFSSKQIDSSILKANRTVEINFTTTHSVLSDRKPKFYISLPGKQVLELCYCYLSPWVIHLNIHCILFCELDSSFNVLAIMIKLKQYVHGLNSC